MSAGFKSELDVRLHEYVWQHLDDLIWEGSDGDRVVVPKGRTTDFASVPRVAQILLPSADPRVVRAAAVHDELCRRLNEFYALWLEVLERCRWDRKAATRMIVELYADKIPEFNAVDTDAVFKKIMADEGAGFWMQATGWVGVRWGALKNPARRQGWFKPSQCLPVLGLTAAALAPLAGLIWWVLS